MWLVLIFLPLSFITWKEKRVEHAFFLKMFTEPGKGDPLGRLSAQHPN